MQRLVLLPALLAILVGAPPALAWTWPVDGPVLRPFALGGDPYASGQHRGIDVGAAEGAPVHAPASGTVTFAGSVPSGGRTITIQTPDGYAVTLLHLGAVLVAEGDTVAEAADVGVVGWSGDPEHTAPSVHLGVRIAAQTAGYLDPLSLLPPPASSTAVAGAQSNEPATTPAVGVDGHEAAAPVVEVATLPPQPGEAGPSPAAQPQGEQPALAEPIVAEVPLLGPAPVASVPNAAPPAASAAPADAAAPEPSGVASADPASVPAGAETTSYVAAPSSGDATRPTETAATRPTSVSVSGPDARRGEPQTRADRLEPIGRPHRVRIDRRTEPFVEGRPAAVRSGTGSIEPEASGLSHVVREPEQGAGPVPESSAGAWLAHGALATILAALTVVLVTRRSGRGGQRTASCAVPPSTPPLGAAQGAETGLDLRQAASAPRRTPARFRRHLDRGGPGGPAKRAAAGVRGSRASV